MGRVVGHLDILSEARFSSQQLRIVHNTSLKLMFLNCTQTRTCKYDFKGLVTGPGATAKCNGCGHVYENNGYSTTFRGEEVGHNWDDPLFQRWIANWLGVEARCVRVTVT